MKCSICFTGGWEKKKGPFCICLKCGVVAPLVVTQCGAFLMGPDAHYPQVSGVIAVNFV